MSKTETTTVCPVQEPRTDGGISKPASEVVDEENQDRFGDMLSISLSTPLAGAARAEKTKQMANNHPAIINSRSVQQVLVKIQQSLRRMPGVAGAQSSDIVLQLQEVGQVISRETTALVDALMGLTLDQQDTDKAVARMSIEANIAKAQIDDQGNTIQMLEERVKNEIERRALSDKSDKSASLKGEKNSPDSSKSVQSHDGELIKTLRETNTHLEEQVNGRRSLWVLKHPDEQSLTRAIDTLRESADNFPAAQGALMSLRQNVTRANGNGSNHATNSANLAAADSGHDYGLPSSSSNDLENGITSPDFYKRPVAAQPPIGSFRGLSGPIRPPSTAPYSRRGNPPSSSASWDQQQKQPSAAPRGASMGGINSTFTMSSFSRGGSVGRKSFAAAQNNSRFSPNAAEFYPWNPTSGENGIGGGVSLHPMGTGNGGGARHASATFVNGGSSTATANSNNNNNHRDYYPRTPTAASRSRYGRVPEGPPSAGSDSTGGGVSLNNAMVSRNNTTNNHNHNIGGGGGGGAMIPSASFLAPLVHMNERSVAVWHTSIMEFYAVIRAFVERHASQPDHASSMKMSSTPLWPILLATYHPLSDHEASSYLEYHLRNENSKACLVTRVMIDYIVNRVWTPAAWNGADDDSTYSLIELEQDMERAHGQPSAFRQPLLDRQAAIIDGILSKEHDTPFHKSKVDEITSTLLSNLQPLLNRLANPADAYRDMEQVAEHAWALSSRILMSRLTFDFRFPEIGSRFSSQSMLPIWPRMDPFELQAKHWRVALVTTPVITCRNDTGTNISAHSVSLADVFCMH